MRGGGVGVAVVFGTTASLKPGPAKPTKPSQDSPAGNTPLNSTIIIFTDAVAKNGGGNR